MEHYFSVITFNLKCQLKNNWRIVFKETKSVTMDIFQKKYFLFIAFVKEEFSFVFTIKMLSTAENCMKK